MDSYRPINCPPAYVTVFVEVEVDTWTGQVRTVKAVMGSDCGTVINPDLAAGQLEGGLSKGAGYALLEDNDWDANGQLLLARATGSTPRRRASPRRPLLEDISTHFADTYEPTGPFGAKGIGEAATNPVAAAYANAIYNAIGIRFYELPITPEKILRLRRLGRSRDRKDSPRRRPMNEMTNSHILVHEFTYLEPASLAEAVALLAELRRRGAGCWPAAPTCWCR